MSINPTTFTNRFRLSGLGGSGLDTDQLVSDLMRAERVPLDKLYQKRQLAVWKQEAYRDITNRLRALKDEYFNLAKPATNMLSESSYKKFNVSSTDGNVVTATASPDVVTGVHQIVVKQLATGESRVSTNPLTAPIKTSDTVASIMGALGGTLKDIDDNGDLIVDRQEINFKINGKDFAFSGTDTLYTVITRVNSSAANVTMQFDEITNRIKLTSKITGAIDGVITATDEGGTNFLSKVNLADASDPLNMLKTTSHDAEVSIDDGINTLDVNASTYLNYSKNTFTVNGIVFSLKTEKPGVVQSLTITQDTDAIYKNIVDFVNKYNETIQTLNTKTSEKYDRKYPPLTEEQKEVMKEEDVKKWEATAKTGLLRNDSILQNITSNMRRALYDKVEGSSISMSSIGITTGNYLENGKLIIDETKLKTAISNNPDAVMQLFSHQSTSVPSNLNIDATQRTTRYNENGLAYRLSDILDDNIRTYGGKGFLLEKAGIPGDLTEIKNTMFDQIKGYNTNIDNLVERLTNKETDYYNKFARLEKLLANMNNQGNAFASQMGVK